MAYNSGVQPTASSRRVAALHSGFRQRLTPGVGPQPIAPLRASIPLGRYATPMCYNTPGAMRSFHRVVLRC